MKAPHRFVFYVVLENDQVTDKFFATRAEAREWINENDDPDQGSFRVRRAKGVLFET